MTTESNSKRAGYDEPKANVQKPVPLSPDEDKGEQCVYCGKDSWTCEHFEAANRDAGGSLADYETDAERNR